MIDLSKKSRVRGFELIEAFPDARLPERGTSDSAGYDFFSLNEVILAFMFFIFMS